MAWIGYAEWAERSDAAAQAEGWSLYEADGCIDIEVIDDPDIGAPKFDSDAAAVTAVFAAAARGDEKSLLALYLDGKDTDYQQHWIPDDLSEVLQRARVVEEEEHLRLRKACAHVLSVLELMPTPKLGEWNWPYLANQLREALDKPEA